MTGVNAGYSSSKGEVKENGTTHTNSTVTASDKLTIESGKDTTIVGGKASGDSVEMNVGGNLNIESQQDSQKYDEKYTSGGLNVNINYATGAGISGGASSGTTKSDYNSVTDQSGIYAGEGGFNITVDKNTDLKGGVIDSDATPDKNKLTTGTLTWEDVDNKAEYSSKDVGINVNINNGAKDNEKGVTPNIGMPAKGEDESTTKAGVAQGTIEITDKENQKQNIEDLNRDTKNTLNKLEQIFDKQTVAERKEMAALFGELAYNEIHRISERAGWKDGSPEKVALHAFVGGIMSELTGSGFLSGASGAAVNEFIQKQLSDAFKDNPDMHQWASALVGAAVSGVVSGNAQAGASSSASGTKHNVLDHEQDKQKDKDINEAANDRNSAGTIMDEYNKWKEVDENQQEQLAYNLENTDFVAGMDAALKENPDLTEYNGVIIKGVDINGNIIDATNPINRQSIIDGEHKFVNQLISNGITSIPDGAIAAMESAHGSIQKLKGTPIYNTLKAAGYSVDVVCIGNIIYTDVENFEGKDLAMAIVYDTAGYAGGKIGGALGGAAIGAITLNPYAIGVGAVAGSSIVGTLGANWADERKAKLNKK